MSRKILDLCVDTETCNVKLRLKSNLENDTDNSSGIFVNWALCKTPDRGQALGPGFGLSYIEETEDHCETIINPPGSGEEIYIAKNGDGWLLSSNMENIFETVELNLSPSNYLKYLNDVWEPGISIWEDVYVLSSGQKAIITPDHRICVSFIDQERIKSTHLLHPADILNTIVEQAAETGNVGIRFSGGLDSTAILAACGKMIPNEKLVAATWHHPGSSSPTDLERARKITQQMAVSHLEIPLEESMIFSGKVRRLSAYPSTALAFSEASDHINESIRGYFGGQKTAIFDGHGGDHLFLQHVYPHMLFNCLKGKEHGFIKKLKEYCALYSVGYPSIVWKLINGLEKQTNKLLKNECRFAQPWQDRYSSSWNIRLNLVHQALNETSNPLYSSEKDLEILHPFLNPKMIDYALSVDVSQSFNEKYTRLHLRKALAERFDPSLFFRMDKGSITGIFQKSLGIKKNKLLDLILNGYGASLGFLDEGEVVSMYNKSAAGINGVNHHLLRLVCGEMLISLSKEKMTQRRQNVQPV